MDFVSFTTAKKLTAFILLIALTACGGGGGTANVNTNSSLKPSAILSTASNDAILTISGKTKPRSSVTITFPNNETKNIIADDNGNFSFTSDQPQNSGEIIIVSTSNGESATTNINFTADLESTSVLKALYKATGVMPELSFKPSLGVNTEAPQGADTAGMPMPFVDIFRTARPFTDQSSNSTSFDQYGWPIKFAPSFNYARTKLLQGALKDSIPNGTYTVLYENYNADSYLEFGSGSVSNYQVAPVNGIYEGSFDLNLQDFSDENDEIETSSKNAINLNIRGNAGIGAITSLKNIRFVMPGGTCEGNPYLRVSSVSECPAGVVYRSFSERLKNNREAIIFNPDYLLFLRNFKVIRMMNLMEASHGKAYCSQADGCPNRVDTWTSRSTLSDAVWGGSDRTDYTKRNGVPVEVIVELANILERDIWVNMPHPANDDYITQFATYINNNLNDSSKIYIEYSNEIWNSGFTGHDYVISKGNAIGLQNNLPPYYETLCSTLSDKEKNANRCGKYFSGLRYYSKRSSEVFDLWTNIYGSTDKLIRVLGTSQGDIVRTDEMIKYVGQNDVDAIAMAPYFYGCAQRNGYCADTSKVPKVLADATSVNDVFNIIDQEYNDDDQANIYGDSSALQGTLAKIKRQLSITSQNGIDLISYEGGQHLTTSILTHFIEIPAIINSKLNIAGTLSEATRTEILDKLDIDSAKITENENLIKANAISDGVTLPREQDVIDRMAIYRTFSSAYVISVKDVLLDNEITTDEASAMQLDYSRLNIKRAQVVEAQKTPYRKLFKDANRDPRMKQRYIDLLEGWKSMASTSNSSGTTLFTLYTLPQSYYRFGNWGLKEHLNKSRAESPKFDGVMIFQEAVGNCWWDEAGCTP